MWKWAASGKKTSRRNDRYVELRRVGEDYERRRGGFKVCLHPLKGVERRMEMGRKRRVGDLQWKAKHLH